ncbi:hypothetical protein HAX54_002748 [Datura stramonium]|uniref:Uncharacterized protein n=1 Tax=Datura stramonium TaxID=4076 RepID=A0ABS8T6G7_DATST|nr:hypothetical protein [Datura stramonium]
MSSRCHTGRAEGLLAMDLCATSRHRNPQVPRRRGEKAARTYKHDRQTQGHAIIPSLPGVWGGMPLSAYNNFFRAVLSDYPEAKMTIEQQKSCLGESLPELAERLDDGIPKAVGRKWGCEKQKVEWRKKEELSRDEELTIPLLG